MMEQQTWTTQNRLLKYACGCKSHWCYHRGQFKAKRTSRLDEEEMTHPVQHKNCEHNDAYACSEVGATQCEALLSDGHHHCLSASELKPADNHEHLGDEKDSSSEWHQPFQQAGILKETESRKQRHLHHGPECSCSNSSAEEQLSRTQQTMAQIHL